MVSAGAYGGLIFSGTPNGFLTSGVGYNVALAVNPADYVTTYNARQNCFLTPLALTDTIPFDVNNTQFNFTSDASCTVTMFTAAADDLQVGYQMPIPLATRLVTAPGRRRRDVTATVPPIGYQILSHLTDATVPQSAAQAPVVPQAPSIVQTTTLPSNIKKRDAPDDSHLQPVSGSMIGLRQALLVRSLGNKPTTSDDKGALTQN